MKKKIIFFIVAAIIVSALSVFFWVKEKAYVFPLKMGCAHTPLVNIRIEDKSYPVLIDLGYNASLSLDKETIDLIKEKVFMENTYFKTFKGNIYECPDYTIPGIHLGRLLIQNVTCKEEHPDSDCDSLIYEEEGDHKDSSGAIGRELLKRYQVLFDFSNLKMQLFSKSKPIEKRIFNNKKYLKIFYSIMDEGIVIPIMTDFGYKIFLLDTGFSVTHLKKTSKLSAFVKEERYGMKVVESQIFSIQEKNFGPKEIYLLEEAQINDKIDGFLGMDFLRDKVVYIDFDNQCIYLK